MTALAVARNPLRSRLRVRLERRAGRTALVECRAEGQLVARQTGPGEVHLLSQAAGPLNGDQAEIDLVVGPGCSAVVRSSAATIALPSPDDPGPAVVRLTASVAQGAAVSWLPEPVVSAGASRLAMESVWELAADADLLVRESLVLGRHGEHGGEVRSRLVIRREGRDLLSQTLDTAILDRTGRYTGAAERAVATEVRAGPMAGDGPTAAAGRGTALRPEPGLLVATGTGASHPAALAELAAALAAGAAGSGDRPAAAAAGPRLR